MLSVRLNLANLDKCVGSQDDKKYKIEKKTNFCSFVFRFFSDCTALFLGNSGHSDLFRAQQGYKHP